MKFVYPVFELLSVFDKISRNGRNIYESNQIKSIKLYSKLISIKHSRMNQVDRHFEDLEYLNTINIQYSEILFNVTTWGFLKLYRTEDIDVKFGRSTKQIITNQFIITSKSQWTWIILAFSNKCTFTEMNGF